MLVVRRAEERAAGRLAELAERTLRDAFAAMNTPENMRRHREASYGEAVQGREFLDPAVATPICGHEGEMIGYAQLRRAPRRPGPTPRAGPPGRFS